MGNKIPIEELPQEVLEKLGITLPGDKRLPVMIRPQVIAMGGVLLALKGLSNRQALWVLRTSVILVRGYRREKNKNPATTTEGRKRKTVDK